MAINTNSTSFENLDWSKFDFSRWNLDGLPLDGFSSTAATLLQQVISAPAWPKAFASSLPMLKAAVVQQLTQQEQSLKDRSAALDTELADRLTQTQNQITSIQESLRSASAPSALAADPSKFQLVVKAVDQQSQMPLPGLTVQLTDARSPETILVNGLTDLDGNSVLSLAKDQTDKLTGKNADLTLTILSPSGTTLQTIEKGVCSHPNQVETRVASIAASADTAASLDVANRVNTERSALLASLTAKAGQLKALYASRTQDIQTQLSQIQTAITAIQAEINSSTNQPG